MCAAARLPVVGVMGSGRDEHRALAEPLGRLLAALPVHLLTGGGRGVMTAVSRAFAAEPARAGRVIGVLPCREDDPACRPRDGYPNPWVEIAVRTHLPASGTEGEGPHSRNPINVLTADVIVVLPGGDGTASEMRLAIRFPRPMIGLFGDRPPPAGWPRGAPLAAGVPEVGRFVRDALGLG